MIVKSIQVFSRNEIVAWLDDCTGYPTWWLYADGPGARKEVIDNVEEMTRLNELVASGGCDFMIFRCRELEDVRVSVEL